MSIAVFKTSIAVLKISIAVLKISIAVLKINIAQLGCPNESRSVWLPGELCKGVQLNIYRQARRQCNGMLLGCSFSLLACGSRPIAGTSAPATAGSELEVPTSPTSIVLVDDFEDGDGVSSLGGYWYVYDDRENGGLSSIEIKKHNGGLQMVGDGFESQRSFMAHYRLDRGKLPYPPYVGIGVQLGQGHADLRSHAALAYTYKGGKHDVRLETPNVTDYDYYAVQLPASKEWKTVELDLSLFRQAGWGAKVPLILESTQAIGFQLRGETGEEGSFQVDNLRLLPAGQRGPRPATLEIRPAEPPPALELASVAISHPLQKLAMSALDRGYNITNWLEQAPFTGYGSYDEAFVEKLATAGFKGLRLPIDLDLYVQPAEESGASSATPSGPIVLRPELFQVLDNFDRWTAAHGLSLTIDYHQYDRSLDIESAESRQRVVALWGMIAEHFKNSTRQDLFYELLNEPELAAKRGPTAQEWTELAAGILRSIRVHDKKRAVLFGDVRWYGIDELAVRQPFEDPNVIYVFHFYDPFIFTHQGAPWGGLGTTHDVPYPYSPERWSTHQEDFGFTELNEPWQLDQLRSYYRDGHRAALRNRLVKAKAWALKHNVPVICNEFGVYESAARSEDVVRYYTDLIDLFEELQIPWQMWFMTMDAKTGHVEPAVQKALRLNTVRPN